MIKTFHFKFLLLKVQFECIHIIPDRFLTLFDELNAKHCTNCIIIDAIFFLNANDIIGISHWFFNTHCGIFPHQHNIQFKIIKCQLRVIGTHAVYLQTTNLLLFVYNTFAVYVCEWNIYVIWQRIPSHHIKQYTKQRRGCITNDGFAALWLRRQQQQWLLHPNVYRRIIYSLIPIPFSFM